MKRHFAGPKLWVSSSSVSCLLLLLLLLPIFHTLGADAATALKFRRINSTLVHSSRGLTPQASIGVPRRLPSPWGGANRLLALRPPRPQEAAPTTPPAPLDEETETTPTDTANVTAHYEEAFRKRSDDQSSDAANPLSVVWPIRSRSAAASRRLRLPSPTTPAPILLLKLLQPRPTRPAIYSLDGFVPKPSIRRTVSTEPPPHFLRERNQLQLIAASVTRERKAHRYSKVEEIDDADEDYYLSDNDGGVTRRKRRKKKTKKKKRPVSRYTAFARKGVPGEDFPVHTHIPRTEFDCGAQPGLYADPYTDCQVWHMCPGGNLSPRHSFLCPNGTIFNQKKRICDWWYNVDCGKREKSKNILLITE